MEDGYEIVKFVDNEFELEVSVSPKEDTVWLSVEEMAALFGVNRPAIVKHTVNIIQCGELEPSTCSILEQVQNEGDRVIKRKHKIYNLDMIIAVGYRVNSKRGTVFRRWANNVLKQYLLKGYVIDSSRVTVSQENYLNLVNVVNRIDSNQAALSKRVEQLEEKNLAVNNKLFFKGQLFDAFSCLADIISNAKETIVLIDNYVDTGTLDLLSKKKTGVSVDLITSKKGCKLTTKEISDFKNQYGNLAIKFSDEFHDRFMILDNKVLYYIGASLKDAGKKAFEISIIDDQGQLQEICKRIK